jgi:glycosyltransferase involved in cell wall biosynthesis
MSVRPVVSVVIPCHNARAWIAETVQSVVQQQEATALDVIVVDDGSDDGSAEAARDAAGSMTIRVLVQPQSGVSRARNAGTAAARGAFVQYLDADDVLLPDTIARRVDALAQSGADVAYCDYVRWEEQPDGSFREGVRFERQIVGGADAAVLGGLWWPPGALLYRRTVVDAIAPWREDLPIVQDARFLIDAALSGASFVRVPGIGMRYRMHANSLSRRDSRAFLEDCYRNGCELHASWERDGSLDRARRGYLLELYGYLSRSYFPVDRARFTEVVARLKRLDPGYVPAGPRAFRAVSRLVGYPRAEYVAAAWRSLKDAAAQ